MISNKLQNIDKSISKDYSTKIYLTFYRTFVHVNYISDIKQYTLKHFNMLGQTLYEYKIGWSNRFIITMVSEDTVIATKFESNCLIQINLATHQLHNIYHHFTAKYQYSIELYFFSETKLLCVIEKNSDNVLKLTYYNLFNHQQTKLVACFYSKRQSITHNNDTCIKKTNNHSRIVWWNRRIKSALLFSVFQINELNEGKYYQIQGEFSQNLKKQLHQTQIYFQEGIFITNIWQKKKGEYLLQCVQPKRNTNGSLLPIKVKILRLSAGNKNLYRSKIEFNFIISSQEDSFNLGMYCVINFKTKTGILYQTILHTVYINNETEDIIVTESIKCKQPQFGFFFLKNLNYNSNLIYALFYCENNEQIQDFCSIIEKQIFSSSEVALHFLLYCNQDFDDDLLKDAVELINYSDTSNKVQKFEFEYEYEKQQ